MKIISLDSCSFEEAIKFCSNYEGKLRLPTISELETLISKHGVPNEPYWSSSEDDEMVWTGSLVNGHFWKGDEDHETTSKSNRFRALLIESE